MYTYYIDLQTIKNKMTISYCSQVKNRLYQFKQTVGLNLEHIAKNKNTEWVIVDCGSTDGLYNYMKKLGVMDRIHYYKTLNYNTYSIPVAKNFAIRLSSGDYVFNLDIDNYIGNATYHIKRLGLGIGVCCNVFKKGVYGRIGCSREIFNKIGGYDESFLPAGKHDTDFINRCKLLDYKFNHIPCKIKPILNSKIETIKNLDTDIDWKTMNYLNGIKMEKNIKKNIFCPNKKFTKCKFEYNFKKTTSISGRI